MGSAVRWNSFTPSFIVHGSVAPLGTTTGVYGSRAAGPAACWASATSSFSSARPPATSDAVPRRSRRVMLMLVFSGVGLGVVLRWLRRCRFGSGPETAANFPLELGAKRPIIAERLDELSVRVDLGLFRGEQ